MISNNFQISLVYNGVCQMQMELQPNGNWVIHEHRCGTYTGTYTYGVSPLIQRNGEFFQYDGLGSARIFTNTSGVVTATAT